MHEPATSPGLLGTARRAWAGAVERRGATRCGEELRPRCPGRAERSVGEQMASRGHVDGVVGDGHAAAGERGHRVRCTVDGERAEQQPYPGAGVPLMEEPIGVSRVGDAVGDCRRLVVDRVADRRYPAQPAVAWPKRHHRGAGADGGKDRLAGRVVGGRRPVAERTTDTQRHAARAAHVVGVDDVVDTRLLQFAHQESPVFSAEQVGRCAEADPSAGSGRDASLRRAAGGGRASRRRTPIGTSRSERRGLTASPVRSWGLPATRTRGSSLAPRECRRLIH
jgi:hypothetical protein